ncbi:unnamed protein product [Closterium sp. Naga37s-1]|nr:unnamed protein product [Closterium sp. Naga37s-1]
MARNDSAVSPRLFRGTAMILLLALLIPDPTGLETGGTGGGTGHFAEALPFIEPSQPAATSRAFMPRPKGRILLSPRASACHPALRLFSSLSLSPPQSSFPPQPLSSPPSALLLGKPPFPPLEELSRVWGIDVVISEDCADSYSFQVVRECDADGFIVSISYVALPPIPTSISTQFDIIPDVITKLTRLTSLNLEFVDIRGTLPASMGNMTNLQELTISRVESGSIPASFGNMASLQSLIISVSDNDTTGAALTGAHP